MFTIRHIEKQNPHPCSPGPYELLHSVSHLWKNCSLPGEVLAKVPGEEHPLRFATGTVFVMNENGKTVARYDLD